MSKKNRRSHAMPDAEPAATNDSSSVGSDSFFSSLSALRARLSLSVPDDEVVEQTPQPVTPRVAAPTDKNLEAEVVRLRNDLTTSRLALSSAMTSHAAVVVALNREIDSAKKDLKSMEIVSNGVETQNRELEKKFTGLQQQQVSGQALRTVMAKRIENLESELEKVRVQVLGKEESLLRSREEFEALFSKLGRTESERNSLASQVSELQSEFKLLKESSSKAIEDMKAHTKELERSKGKIQSELSDSLAKLKDVELKMNQLKKEKVESGIASTAEISRLKKELHEVRGKVDEIDSMRIKLENKVKYLEDREAELVLENKTLSETMKVAEEEAAEKEKAIASLEEEKVKVREELEKLKTASELDKSSKQLASENDATMILELKSKIKILEKKVINMKHLEEREAKLVLENNALLVSKREVAEEVALKISNIEDAIKEKDEEKLRLRIEYKANIAKLKAVDGSKNESNDAALELEEKIKVLEKDVSTIEENKGKSEELNAQLKEELEEAQDELKCAIEEVERLRNVSEENGSIVALRGKVSELEKKLIVAEERRLEEVTNLIKDVSDLKMKHLQQIEAKAEGIEKLTKCEKYVLPDNADTIEAKRTSREPNEGVSSDDAEKSPPAKKQKSDGGNGRRLSEEDATKNLADFLGVDVTGGEV